MNSKKLDSSLSDPEAITDMCTLSIDDPKNRRLIDAIESPADLWLLAEIQTMLRDDGVGRGDSPDFTGLPDDYNNM